MRSINLYTLNKIYMQYKNKPNIITKYIEHHSFKKYDIDLSELECLSLFVETLENFGAKINSFDDFFYSYTIPQISKEFDLLKIGKEYIVNIELKREFTSTEKIQKQLMENKHYLSHFNKEIVNLTFVSEDLEFFSLNKDSELIRIDIEKVALLLDKTKATITKDLDKEYKITHYLVSPINKTASFIESKYFLTNPQDEIKRKILRNIKVSRFQTVEAVAGTGKSLLLYDLARHFAQRYKVLVVHVAKLCEGHNEINKHFDNIDVITIKALEKYDIKDYSFIFIDEAHRLYKTQVENLNKKMSVNQKCIFFMDKKQCINQAIIKSNATKNIRELSANQIHTLKGKIRTNKELASVVTRLFDNSKTYHKISNDVFEIHYTTSAEDTNKIIEHYENNGYQFIKYTPSQYKFSEINQHKTGMTAHEVIGQEFENIITYMSSNFFYDLNGALDSEPSPYPNYLYVKMLYQIVTRARNKLCIVIEKNPDLYETIVNFL